MMPNAILISIHPEHADKIFKGEKVFEYRTVLPARSITHLALYCTAPVKKIMAVVEVENVLEESPTALWKKTAYGAGISRLFYRKYFKGRKSAKAFALGRVYKLDRPLALDELASCKGAPQSFCYLNAEDWALIDRSLPPIPLTKPSLVFVGGIHGVGKTTLCSKAFSPLGYHCVTASSLIAEHGRRVEKSKMVSDIHGNQNALIEQLAAERSRRSRLVLDGHFSLVNGDGSIDKISPNVFQEIDADFFVLVKESPIEVERRLSIRDGYKWDIAFIEEFQSIEESHAKTISQQFNKRLLIIDGSMDIKAVISNFKKMTDSLI